MFCYLGPGKPRIVNVENTGEKKITVSWQNPTTLNGPLDGISAIARIDRIVKGYCNRTESGDTSCSIKDLDFFTEYNITVVGNNKPSENRPDSGGYGEESEPFTFKTSPGSKYILINIHLYRNKKCFYQY